MKFLRLDEVCARTGLPKSTLYRLMSEGEFPRPIRITERSAAWLEDEVAAWQEQRIAASRPKVAA